jgi:FeS assembly SUF system protein
LETRKLNPQTDEETEANSTQGMVSASPNPTASNEPRSIEEIEQDVIGVLKNCYDPEIPVNIYELGLIYELDIDADRSVHIRMTLTSPFCPVAGTLPPEIEGKVRAVPGVASAKVEVVWDPPWNQSMMSEAARLELGLF